MNRRDFPTFDVAYLLCTGLLALGSWLLGRWARAVDDNLAAFGDD